MFDRGIKQYWLVEIERTDLSISTGSASLGCFHNSVEIIWLL